MFVLEGKGRVRTPIGDGWGVGNPPDYCPHARGSSRSSSTKGNAWMLKQMNHRYLDWVLVQTGGDKSRAAAILNIDLSTLYRCERGKQ